MEKIMICISLFFIFINPYIGYKPKGSVKKIDRSSIDSLLKTTKSLSSDSVLLIYGDSLYIKAEKKIVVLQDSSIQNCIPKTIDYLVEIPTDAPRGIPVAYEYGNEEAGEITPLLNLSHTFLGNKIEEKYFGFISR